MDRFSSAIGAAAGLVALAGIAVLAGCGPSSSQPADEPDTLPPPATTSAPPETPTPLPTPPDGYTFGDPIPGVDIEHVTGLAVVPGDDDAAVITALMGQVYRISLSGAFPPILIADLSERMEPVQGEEGLTSVAFAPGNPDEVYLVYSTGDEDAYFDPGHTPPPGVSPKRGVVARFPLSEGGIDLAGEEIILEMPQPQYWHNVNQVTFDREGLMYVSIGDGGAAESYINGQDITNLYGTIIRIDVSAGGPGYTIPPDNPFVDTGAAPEIYAYGFRNPWRISFDRATGDLWVGDVGQRDWEEVDLVVSGGNYGWACLEGEAGYRVDSPNCPPQGDVQQPKAVYRNAGTPDCAVIGGFVYRGDALLHLRGSYIFTDTCSGRVRALDSTAEQPEIELLFESSFNPYSLAELADGELVVLGVQPGIHKLVAE